MNSYNLQTSAKSVQTLYISVPTKPIFFQRIGDLLEQEQIFLAKQ